MPDAPTTDTRQRIISIRTDSIQTHPRNARRGDVATIRASLERYGQYQPIVVQASTGYVIAGNHRLLAARDLRWTEIDAVQLDVDDDTALRILLMDNKSSDDATYDDQALAELLQSLQGGFDGTGWDQDELDDLLEEMAADADEGAPGAADLLTPPDEDNYAAQFGVIVHCQSESEQEQVYQRLQGLGYNCKVVVV